MPAVPVRVATIAEMVAGELARAPRGTASELAAEVTGVLRLAGRLHVAAGAPVLVADLRTGLVAERLRQAIGELYGYRGEVCPFTRRGAERDGPHRLRVTAHAWDLLRRTGLVDQRGRPVRGIPARVVSGTVGEAAALWRGAFLASGSFAEPARSSLALELACPRHEVALALVGAARRLDLPARARETRDGVRVVVREEDAIARLVARMGAGAAIARWQARHIPPLATPPAIRLASFDQANLRRASDAAARTTARVARALEILADGVPDHLRSAAQLRLRYPTDSLERLGQRAQPPITKDAMAGRLRRLVLTADAVARSLGIPDTEGAVT